MLVLWLIVVNWCVSSTKYEKTGIGTFSLPLVTNWSESSCWISGLAFIFCFRNHWRCWRCPKGSAAMSDFWPISSTWTILVFTCGCLGQPLWGLYKVAFTWGDCKVAFDLAYLQARLRFYRFLIMLKRFWGWTLKLIDRRALNGNRSCWSKGNVWNC